MTNDDCSASPSPTIPNDPHPPSPSRSHSPRNDREEGDQLINHNGDFARLTPLNWPAKLAFSDVVDQLQATMRSGRGEDAAARWKYMHVGAAKEEPSDIESSFSSSQAEAASESSSPRQTIWPGYYRLNLEILPSQYRLGWILGRGRKDLARGGVEFQITTSSKSRVAGRHARFIHNDAGILLIVSDSRTVIIDGKDEFRGGQRALSSRVTCLGFGDLTYRLEFTGLSRYPDQLAALRRQFGTSSDPPAFLDPTPSSTDYVLKEYSIKGAFASGSTCVVMSGFNINTGEPVAIKKIKRDASNKMRIEQEVSFLRRLSHAGVCKLIQDFYITSPASLQRVDEAFLIYPLAEKRLQDVICSSMSSSDRLSIFRQILEALVYLHDSEGIMHRDIKPQNIALLKTAPVHAQLIDFGSATDDITSRDHMAGTVRYLAPEVISLKNPTTSDTEGQPSYTRLVDIWSLGLVMYELFMQRNDMITWTRINRESYVALHRKIAAWSTSSNDINNEQFPQAVVDVIPEMLRYSASQRLGASECLSILNSNHL